MLTTKTNALVDEVLEKDEVFSLLNETLINSGNIDNHLTILKGTLTTWDDELHSGYIVCHTYKIATPETAHDFMPTMEKHQDYYFMEVTLEEVDNPFKTSHLWNPTFHKLLPITENHKRVSPFYEGDTRSLCEYIINRSFSDNWEFTMVPMTKDEIEQGKKRDWWWYSHHTTKTLPLTYNDIYSYWSTPLTDDEQRRLAKEKQVNEATLIARFSAGELPQAEDDVWYSVLSMGYGTSGYDLECKIIKILRDRGYSVRIDGEKDSFGWVTRGIFVNGEIMCII